MSHTTGKGGRGGPPGAHVPAVKGPNAFFGGDAEESVDHASVSGGHHLPVQATPLDLEPRLSRIDREGSCRRRER